MWVRIPRSTSVTYAERFSNCFRGHCKGTLGGICLITNITSEFLNYVLTMPFIMLYLLGSVLIFLSKNVLI